PAVRRSAPWAEGVARKRAAPAALLAGVPARLAHPLLGLLLARGLSRCAADSRAAALCLRLRQPARLDAPPHLGVQLRSVSRDLQHHAVLLVQGRLVLPAVRDGGARLPGQGVPALAA